MLPLKPLPIIERWDCQSCGWCCRDAIVPLTDEDVAKLKLQRWDQRPEFQGVKTVVRIRVGGAKAVLAQKADGGCVFLTAEGRCRIHELHGLEAKPKVCQQFPLQLVPLDGKIVVALRRSCPSAAKGEGRPVVEHLDALKKLLPASLDRLRPTPPAIIGGHTRDWADTRRVTDVFERMLRDARYPLVRRIVHGLEFCDLLAACSPRKLRRVASADFAELVRVAEESACESASEWFRERPAPTRGAATAFRQAAADVLRLHERFPRRPSWSQRISLLRTVFAIARGKGRTPPLVPNYPVVDFAELERPLGALDLQMIRPLDDYFQTLAASLRYCTLAYKKWSVVEGFRSLALQFPIALWAWRWACGGNAAGVDELSAEKLIPIICCLDRAHTAGALTGWRHRHRCDVLAANGQLQRLVVWYAR